MDKERNRSARPSLEVRLARLYRRGLSTIIRFIFYANFLTVFPFLYTFIRAVNLFGAINAIAGMKGHLIFVLQSSKLLVLWFPIILIYLFYALLLPRHHAPKLLTYIATLPLAYLLFDRIAVPQTGVVVDEDQTKQPNALDLFGYGKENTIESRIALNSMYLGNYFWFWFKAKEVPEKLRFTDYLRAITGNFYMVPLFALFPLLTFILYKTMLQSIVNMPVIWLLSAILIGSVTLGFSMVAFNFNIFVSACCKHMTGMWPWEIKT